MSSLFWGHIYLQDKWRSCKNMLWEPVSIPNGPWALLISTNSSMGLAIFPPFIHMAETAEDEKEKN